MDLPSEADIAAAEEFYDEQSSYQFPEDAEFSEDYIHIDVDVISGAELLDEERALGDVLEKKGRLLVGCRELDDIVLNGGLERGRVVGVSSEKEEFGLLVGLQTIAHLLVGEPSDGQQPPSAMIITTLSHEELLPTLRNVVKGCVEALPDVEDAKARVLATLERISISRVFDYDGLRESLDELYLPGEHPLTSEPPPPSPRSGPPEDDCHSEEVGDDEIDMLDPDIHPPSRPPIPDAHQQEHKPPERQQAHTNEDSQDQGQQLKPDIVLITNVPALLTSLFTTREEDDADTTLRNLRRRLRYLTRSPAHAGPLIMMLNAAELVVSGPDDPLDVLELDDPDEEAKAEASPSSSHPASQGITELNDLEKELLPLSSPPPLEQGSPVTPPSPSPMPRDRSQHSPVSPSPSPGPLTPPSPELEPESPTATPPSPSPLPRPPPQTLPGQSSSPNQLPPPQTSQFDSSPPEPQPDSLLQPSQTALPEPLEDPQEECPKDLPEEHLEDPLEDPLEDVLDKTIYLDPGYLLPQLSFEPRETSIFQRPPYPPQNVEITYDGGCIIQAQAEPAPPRFWMKPFFAEGFEDLVDLHLVCMRLRKGGEGDDHLEDEDSKNDEEEIDGDEDREAGDDLNEDAMELDHDNGDVVDEEAMEIDEEDAAREAEVERQDAAQEPEVLKTEVKEEDLVWVVEVLLDKYGVWDKERRLWRMRDERWGAVDVETSETGAIMIVDAYPHEDVIVDSEDEEEMETGGVFEEAYDDGYGTWPDKEDSAWREPETTDDRQVVCEDVMEWSQEEDEELPEWTEPSTDDEGQNGYEDEGEPEDTVEEGYDEETKVRDEVLPGEAMECQEEIEDPEEIDDPANIGSGKKVMNDQEVYDFFKPDYADYVLIMAESTHPEPIQTYEEYLADILARTNGGGVMYDNEAPSERENEHQHSHDIKDAGSEQEAIQKEEYEYLRPHYEDYLRWLEETNHEGPIDTIQEFAAVIHFRFGGDEQSIDQALSDNDEAPSGQDMEVRESIEAPDYVVSEEEAIWKEEVYDFFKPDYADAVRSMEECGYTGPLETYDEYLADMFVRCNEGKPVTGTPPLSDGDPELEYWGGSVGDEQDVEHPEPVVQEEQAIAIQGIDPRFEKAWNDYMVVMEKRGTLAGAMDFEEYVRKLNLLLSPRHPELEYRSAEGEPDGDIDLAEDVDSADEDTRDQEPVFDRTAEWLAHLALPEEFQHLEEAPTYDEDVQSLDDALAAGNPELDYQAREHIEYAVPDPWEQGDDDEDQAKMVDYEQSLAKAGGDATIVYGSKVYEDYHDEWNEHVRLLTEAGCPEYALTYEEFVDDLYPPSEQDEFMEETSTEVDDLSNDEVDDDLQTHWAEYFLMMDEAGAAVEAMSYEEYLQDIHGHPCGEEQFMEEAEYREEADYEAQAMLTDYERSLEVAEQDDEDYDLEAEWAEYFLLMDGAGLAGEALSYEEYLQDICQPASVEGDDQRMEDARTEDDDTLFHDLEDEWARYFLLMDAAGCPEEALTYEEYLADIFGTFQQHLDDAGLFEADPEMEYWGGEVDDREGRQFDYWGEGLGCGDPGDEYDGEEDECFLEVPPFIDAEEDEYRRYKAGWEGDVDDRECADWEAWQQLLKDVRVWVEEEIEGEGGGEAMEVDEGMEVQQEGLRQEEDVGHEQQVQDARDEDTMDVDEQETLVQQDAESASSSDLSELSRTPSLSGRSERGESIELGGEGGFDSDVPEGLENEVMEVDEDGVGHGDEFRGEVPGSQDELMDIGMSP